MFLFEILIELRKRSCVILLRAEIYCSIIQYQEFRETNCIYRTGWRSGSCEFTVCLQEHPDESQIYFE